MENRHRAFESNPFERGTNTLDDDKVDVSGRTGAEYGAVLKEREAFSTTSVVEARTLAERYWRPRSFLRQALLRSS